MKRVVVLLIITLFLLAGCAEQDEEVRVKVPARTTVQDTTTTSSASSQAGQQKTTSPTPVSGTEDTGSEEQTTTTTTSTTTTSTTTSSTGLIRDFRFSLPLFSAGSAWNQKATGAKVLPDSDKQMLVLYRVMLGDTSDISSESTSPGWAYMDIGYDEYSVAISRASNEKTSIPLCNYYGALDWTNPKVLPDSWYDEGGPVTIPKPAGQIRPPGPQDTDADGHLVLYNPSTGIEYDFWQPTTVGNGKCKSLGGGRAGTAILEAGMVDFFNIKGIGSNPPGDEYSSARASGAALLAGMILPEDIESGEIKHALAVAIPAPLIVNKKSPVENVDYFYPASRPEETFYNTNKYAVAQGQRLRLKQTLVDEDGELIDETDLAPVTLMFLKALRTYGAYVVDNAEGFSFSAEDIHTAPFNPSDDALNKLIGKPVGTSLPSGKSRWQVVLDALIEDLETIPIAEGENDDTPRKATIEISNFEVVAPATRPN